MEVHSSYPHGHGHILEEKLAFLEEELAHPNSVVFLAVLPVVWPTQKSHVFFGGSQSPLDFFCHPRVNSGLLDLLKARQKWQKNDLVSGGHGKARSLGRP